jgi:CDP-glycerol glycerophosphotransferase
LLPISKNKVLIESYCGRGYGDNPKYIAEALLKQNEKIKIIWIVKSKKDTEQMPKDVITCRYRSLKRIYHLSTAKVWIDNCRKDFVFKRKKQIYIQTWHGFALKRIEKDVADKLNEGYVKTCIHDAKHTDYIISCSSFMTNIYRNSFWYDGEIVEWGAPRNDIFLTENRNIREKVYGFYNLKPETKTVVYAPTFRADETLEPYSVDYMRLKKACEKRFGGDFVVLVRLHPNIAAKSKELGITYTDELVNATYYPDMQELLCACDIVISDYSSLMFDFALSYKPCFQFATDIDAYKGDRNFYFDLSAMPFALATNNDELEKNVLAFEEEEYKSALTEFYKSVGMVMDGKSSEKCAEMILKYCDGRYASV